VKAIVQNTMRSGLTALGIIIGVGAVAIFFRLLPGVEGGDAGSH
jgi:hypothetical protein